MNEEEFKIAKQAIIRRAQLYMEYETELFAQYDGCDFNELAKCACLNGFILKFVPSPGMIMSNVMSYFRERLNREWHTVNLEHNVFFSCGKFDGLKSSDLQMKKPIVFCPLPIIVPERLISLYYDKVKKHTIFPVELIPTINNYLFGIFPYKLPHQNDVEFCERSKRIFL